MTNLAIQNTKTNSLDNLDSKVQINGRVYQTTFAEQVNGKNSLELNGEDFILLGVASPSPKFNLPIKKGTQHIVAYKKPHENKSSDELKEISGNMFASAMLALFPMGELFEQFKTIMEMASKVKEGAGTKIGFTFTQNIDPKAAINPNKAFLPSSPFYMPAPSPLLWDRVRKEAIELKNKKQKKAAKGLGF